MIKSQISLDLNCDQTILTNDNRFLQVIALEEKLQKMSSEKIVKARTHEDLKTVAEMFLYLTICPKTIQPWFRFYKDLFQIDSPDKIIIALNRLMQATNNPRNESFKTSAKKFLKIMFSMYPGRLPEKTASNIGKYF